MIHRHTYRKSPWWTRAILVAMAFLFLPAVASAVTKKDADDMYRKGNYQQAIVDYKELLRDGVSANIYYNLGNSYYRMDSIAQAILAYERAHLLSPDDKDIQFNLRFARSKTIDKMMPDNDVIFLTWYKSMVNVVSPNTWAVISIVSIVLALVLTLFYLFSSRLGLRKMGFYGGLVFLVLFVLSTVFGWTQKYDFEHRSGAIIVSPSVTVKKVPTANGSDAFVIHEGSRVDVVDSSIKGWKAIKLADGREGWISVRDLEMI